MLWHCGFLQVSSVLILFIAWRFTITIQHLFFLFLLQWSALSQIWCRADLTRIALTDAFPATNLLIVNTWVLFRCASWLQKRRRKKRKLRKEGEKRWKTTNQGRAFIWQLNEKFRTQLLAGTRKKMSCDASLEMKKILPSEPTCSIVLHSGLHHYFSRMKNGENTGRRRSERE